MTAEQFLADLEAKARAATLEEWREGTVILPDGSIASAVVTVDGDEICNTGQSLLHDVFNSCYIAAANPAAVLRLVGMARNAITQSDLSSEIPPLRIRREYDEMRELNCPWCGGSGHVGDCDEADQAVKNQLERLENALAKVEADKASLREENERLAGMRAVQLQEAAVELINGAIRMRTEGDGNAFSLGMTCPHCDMHFSTVEEAVAHDAACPKHPASIRAERLEKEIGWLTMVLANASLGMPLSEYIEEDANGMSPPAPEHWRDAARKALEERD